MNILVGAQLNQYTPKNQSRFTIELEEAEPLHAILDSLHVPLDMVHLLIINGRITKLDGAVVSNQDKVVIYPYITGG